ncbi:MAG: hypothetical protein ACE5IC_06580 [Candidatus Brocadiales bacterium]
MVRKEKRPKFPRLKCPSEKVFKDKKRRRIKKPTPEELRDLKDTDNE